MSGCKSAICKCSPCGKEGCHLYTRAAQSPPVHPPIAPARVSKKSWPQRSSPTHHHPNLRPNSLPNPHLQTGSCIEGIHLHHDRNYTSCDGSTFQWKIFFQGSTMKGQQHQLNVDADKMQKKEKKSNTSNAVEVTSITLPKHDAGIPTYDTIRRPRNFGLQWNSNHISHAYNVKFNKTYHIILWYYTKHPTKGLYIEITEYYLYSNNRIHHSTAQITEVLIKLTD